MYCIAADSEAVAATTMVCAIAPFSSSLRTMLATVEAFCPIATYTHLMPVLFWLITASIASAVLPVPGSPSRSSGRASDSARNPTVASESSQR